MNKRHWHHYWRKLKLLRPWYFLALAGFFGIICIFSLRGNYQHMVKLRSAVYAADKSGNNVSPALNDLRSYVYAHMNTNLATSDGVYPPIQLKYTYDRLVKAETGRVASVNSQVYTQAQAYCEQQDPVDFSGHNRVPCIDNYVSVHGAKAQSIPDALYKFDFASPRWSPDLAGWSLIVTIASLAFGGVLLALKRWVTS
jgi:hypothetical protein